MVSSCPVFRSRTSRQRPNDTVRRAYRPAGAQSFVVAGAAIATGVILLLSGALDDHASVNIDPSGTGTTVTTTRGSADSVMVGYLTAQKTWNECVTADPSAASCGKAPAQPDDPRLNAYLSDLLDWNKCAAPRLRRGGMETAIAACGPQPASPLGG